MITSGAGMTVMESAWSSVSGVPWLSVTRTVKLDVPLGRGRAAYDAGGGVERKAAGEGSADGAP